MKVKDGQDIDNNKDWGKKIGKRQIIMLLVKFEVDYKKKMRQVQLYGKLTASGRRNSQDALEEIVKTLRSQ